MALPPQEAGLIDVNTAAKMLMLESPRRIQQLVSEGWIQREANGKYRTIAVVQGYIKFLKDVAERKNQNISENRVRDARARKLDIENARAEHDLVEFEEVSGLLDEIAGMLKSEFLGFPAAMTRDPTMRRKLESGIDAIFGRATARIAETLAALAATGAVVETDSEDEPG